MAGLVLKRPANVLVAVVTPVFIIVNAVNALRKGGDFSVFLEAGERFVRGVPLYSGSVVGGGVVGPPFQGLFFAPFALLAQVDPAFARLVWYALNLAALATGVWAWTAAIGPAAGRVVRWHRWRPEPSRPVLMALLAILFPLQTNLEHQNMNLVLLALTGAAAWALARERDRAAGLAIGVATALKAFPGLLLLYVMFRGRWRAAGVGIVTAGVLTLLPALRYGTDGVAGEVRDWLTISASGGWPVRGNNQSLFAMLARWFGPDGLGQGEATAGSHPRVYAAWLAVAACVGAATFLASSRWRAPAREAAPIGLVALLALAVLLSPIAWDHYWVLMFPAFLLLALAPDDVRWARPVFWIAAILVSGFSRATVGADGLAAARALSVFTLAGILLLAATLALQHRLAAPARSVSRT